MRPHHRELLVHIVGGVAVLGSYAWGAMQPAASGLWGRLPEAAIAPYTAMMPLAAIGYLLTMARSLQRSAHGEPSWAPTFAMILAASTAWLPLCILDLASPTRAGWWAIELDLITTAAGALVIAKALWTEDATTRLAKAARWGWIAFCIQTVVLDALIWPQFFGVL